MCWNFIAEKTISSSEQSQHGKQCQHAHRKEQLQVATCGPNTMEPAKSELVPHPTEAHLCIRIITSKIGSTLAMEDFGTGMITQNEWWTTVTDPEEERGMSLHQKYLWQEWFNTYDGKLAQAW
jgi:hypothetical protein